MSQVSMLALTESDTLDLQERTREIAVANGLGPEQAEVLRAEIEKRQTRRGQSASYAGSLARYGKATASLGEHSDDPEGLLDAYLLALPAGTSLLEQRLLLGKYVPPVVEFLPTTTLGENLFYREMVFIVSGHKKSGKSLALFASGLDCVAAGIPVVYLDLENGARTFSRRLDLLRADREEVDERLHYFPFPRGLALHSLPYELDAIAEQLPGAFIIVDSLRGLIARLSPANDPLKVNDQQSIEKVCAPFMEAAKTKGLTVGIIDHPTKAGDDSSEYSTAGSGAKEQAVDAVYFWTKTQPYNQDTAGAVTLAATSDREALLDFKRCWTVGGQGIDKPLQYVEVDEGQVKGSSIRIRADVRQLLKDTPGTRYSLTKLRKTVKGDNAEVDAAVKHLAADPEHDSIHAVTEGTYVAYMWDESIEAPAGIGV